MLSSGGMALGGMGLIIPRAMENYFKLGGLNEKDSDKPAGLIGPNTCDLI